MHIRNSQQLILLFYLFSFALSAQDSSKLNQLISFPDKLFSSLDKKISAIEQKLDKQTDKYLSKLQSQENKLFKKLYRKDSVLARQIFADVDEKYNQFKTTTGKVNKYQHVYSGHLDFLSTALSFLKDQDITQKQAYEDA